MVIYIPDTHLTQTRTGNEGKTIIWARRADRNPRAAAGRRKCRVNGEKRKGRGRKGKKDGEI